MKRLPLLGLLAAALVAQSAPEVEITAEPHHHLILSNNHVRVFYVDVPAHGETLKHWHHHDYIYVTLGDCSLVNSVVGKPPVTLQLHDGLTQFSPGPFLHSVHDTSDAPFRNVTIEVLEDARLRTAHSPWTEDRGLDILHGGTAEVLWVNDAIRATEIELQPNAVFPESNYTPAQLLVAITDLELRGAAPGPALTSIHLKSGEVRWLHAGETQQLTNAGHTLAKFVTLEFP